MLGAGASGLLCIVAGTAAPLCFVAGTFPCTAEQLRMFRVTCPGCQFNFVTEVRLLAMTSTDEVVDLGKQALAMANGVLPPPPPTGLPTWTSVCPNLCGMHFRVQMRYIVPLVRDEPPLVDTIAQSQQPGSDSRGAIVTPHQSARARAKIMKRVAAAELQRESEITRRTHGGQSGGNADDDLLTAAKEPRPRGGRPRVGLIDMEEAVVSGGEDRDSGLGLGWKSVHRRMLKFENSYVQCAFGAIHLCWGASPYTFELSSATLR